LGFASNVYDWRPHGTDVALPRPIPKTRLSRRVNSTPAHHLKR
jgi:hypothetical protein